MTTNCDNSAASQDGPVQRLRAVLRTLRFAAPAERRRLLDEARQIEREILRASGRERRGGLEIPEAF